VSRIQNYFCKNSSLSNFHIYIRYIDWETQQNFLVFRQHWKPFLLYCFNASHLEHFSYLRSDIYYYNCEYKKMILCVRVRACVCVCVRVCVYVCVCVCVCVCVWLYLTLHLIYLVLLFIKIVISYWDRCQRNNKIRFFLSCCHSGNFYFMLCWRIS